MLKSAKIPEKAHQWLITHKGKKSIGNVISDLINFYQYEKLAIGIKENKRPENPEKITFKCDSCNGLFLVNGPWPIGYKPEIEEIEFLNSKIIEHGKYNNGQCNGRLRLYNIPIIERSISIKEEQILMKVAKLDKNIIVISKISGKTNPRVGILINPYGNKFKLRIISIIDVYKILEFLAKYNNLKNVIEKLLNMNLQIDEKKHLRKEILLQIKKIYDEHDTILPDGMFKQICLLIP